MKYFFLVCIAIFIFLNLYQWNTCKHLFDMYYFSEHKVWLLLDDAIHNDTYIPFPVIRLFHNKPIFLLKGLFDTGVLYWDIKFLFTLLTPVGVIGMVYGLFHSIRSLVQSRQKLPHMIIILSLFIFPVAFMFRFFPALPFYRVITLPSSILYAFFYGWDLVFSPTLFFYHLITLFSVLICISIYGWSLIIIKHPSRWGVYSLVLIGISLLWTFAVPAELGWVCQL